MVRRCALHRLGGTKVLTVTVTCAVPAGSPAASANTRRQPALPRRRPPTRASQCRIYGVREPFFSVDAELPGRLGRAGVIRTPHGDIHTPAFIAVGTQGTAKAVLRQIMKKLCAHVPLAHV